MNGFPHPTGACSWLKRRQLFSAGGLGMFGLKMPRFLRAVEQQPLERLVAKAKSVIFCFQWGGPSHLETFDMKPDTPEGVRGFHKHWPQCYTALLAGGGVMRGFVHDVPPSRHPLRNDGQRRDWPRRADQLR